MSHHRASSFGGDSGNWTSDSHGRLVGTAKGVGKGMFGVAAEATRRLTSPKFSSPRSKHKGSSDTSPAGSRLVPAQLSSSLPKYELCVSSDLSADVPNLKIRTPTCNNSISVEVGPDDGIFECLNAMIERKKLLKNLLKKLQQNPNALREDDSPYVKYDLGIEDIKFKFNNFKEAEKKLKTTNLYSNAQKRIEHRLHSDPRIYGRTIDTYAFDAVRCEKAGQPNADSFYAEGFPRNICFGVADGIGWGELSRRASQSALLGFCTYFKNEIAKRLQRTVNWDTNMVADVCRSALGVSHIFVNGMTEAKTTFVGGMIVELMDNNNKNDEASKTISIKQSYGSSSDDEDGEDSTSSSKSKKKNWSFVGISVGDTLVYRYSTSRDVVSEVTSSDRTGGVRDAGGSIGGRVADLRNMSYHYCMLEEGDYIIAVSDGVHDNLDPEVLKVSPSSLDINVQDDCWINVPDELKNNVKRQFKEDQLRLIINNSYSSDSSSVLSSNIIVDRVIDFVWQKTNDHRTAYEKGSELQRDWNSLDPERREITNQEIQNTLKNPVGKFDHVTCLCIKVMSV